MTRSTLVCILAVVTGCRFLLGEGDESSQESGPDATGRSCGWGARGFPEGICIDEVPAAPINLDLGVLDTDRTGLCIPYTGGGSDDYCVIAGSSLTLNVRLRVVGSKALVVISSGAITLKAHLEVTAQSNQSLLVPGGDPIGGCNAGQRPATDALGGAGGSFSGRGGRGGGRTTVPDGGISGAIVTHAPPGMLRGGCRGQDRPSSTDGGRGGGAVALLAAGPANIEGHVLAGGAAGDGGSPGLGGAGGGSGGMIFVQCTDLTLGGHLVADGGGGGEGGTATAKGAKGEEPEGASAARGGTGNITGGDGGAGSFEIVRDGLAAAGSGNADSGGGGGGGAGVIWIDATRSTLYGRVTPTAFEL